MSVVWFEWENITHLLSIKGILTWLSVSIILAHSLESGATSCTSGSIFWSGKAYLVKGRSFIVIQVETVAVSNWEAQNYELFSPSYLWLLKEFTAVFLEGKSHCLWCSRQLCESRQPYSWFYSNQNILGLWRPKRRSVQRSPLLMPCPWVLCRVRALWLFGELSKREQMIFR